MVSFLARSSHCMYKQHIVFIGGTVIRRRNEKQEVYLRHPLRVRQEDSTGRSSPVMATILVAGIPTVLAFLSKLVSETCSLKVKQQPCTVDVFGVSPNYLRFSRVFIKFLQFLVKFKSVTADDSFCGFRAIPNGIAQPVQDTVRVSLEDQFSD